MSKHLDLPYYRWAVQYRISNAVPWSCEYVFHTRKDAREVAKAWKPFYYKVRSCKLKYVY